VTRKRDGLFPSPREIQLDCSCPDWATMCKHVAATLYGVGARLDRMPELLFALRDVDPAEMVEAAVTRTPARGTRRKGRVLKADQLSSVFGIELDVDGPSADADALPAKRARRTVRKKQKKKIKRTSRARQRS
jgi:uncharacterized Zn finger protein